ncbi:hypothetical protein Tco_0519224 [Tanacetum coccineum]
MADSWKSMDLNKFVVNDDRIDYLLHKYGSNWLVHDVIADDILDDLLKRDSTKAKKATIPSEIVQWYDDLSSDEQRTVYKGRLGSSSKNAAITKLRKLKSRPPPVTNCILGLAVVTTWQQILNKEFGIKRSKEDVRGSLYVRRKGKRKMMYELQFVFVKLV